MKSHDPSDPDFEIARYSGEWDVVESATPLIKGDMSLKVVDNAKHAAISAMIKPPIDPKGKTLVIQYEVNPQDGLECGGSYMKLFTDSKDYQPESMIDTTPYTIMFGPDVCGGNNKVHFIFRHQNPISKVWEEKHLISPPPSGLQAGKWSLYTLIVKPDQTFDLLINNKSAASGSLLEKFLPAVNPEKLIDDESDVKPDDWVDDEKIPDPDAVKPDDWDEDAPRTIPDESAVKPDDWCDDCPVNIPDPEVTKPDEWDDEDDGEWTAPLIPNPQCENSGCGEWIRPQIKNPEYKGKWSAPLIKNPDFKGVWTRKKIPNPNYFEDLNPAAFTKIGAVGFELWNMKANILFDNIYIGHNIEDAKELAKESWTLKHELEKKLEPKSDEDKDTPELSDNKFIAQLQLLAHAAQNYANDAYMDILEFFEILKADPVAAIKELPHVPFIVASLVTLPLLLLGLIFTGSSKKGKKVEKPKKESAKTDEVVSDEDKPENETLRKRKSSPKKAGKE